MPFYEILGIIYIIVIIIMFIIRRSKEVERLELANKFAATVFVISAVILLIKEFVFN